MKIGILKADDVRPELVGQFGEYPDMFREVLVDADPDVELRTYEIVLGEYPEDIHEVDGYIITGSKASAYDADAWILKLGEFIQRLHREKKKLVGICFGHQMVAHFLGGITGKSEKGWGVGIHQATFTNKASDYGAKGNTFSLVCSHQDQIVVPAPQSVILAKSDFCPYSMLQIGDHILTLQGHPEFKPEFSGSLLELRRHIVGESCFEQGLRSLKQPTDAYGVGKWIVDFISPPLA
ncbi:MAG: GMP synthase [Gammaproteobacteria bacterium]|nr:GMP synthase [Gammaproteobacteria bacterium]